MTDAEFGSPLERIFFESVAHKLVFNAEIIPQYRVDTLCGPFYLDFAIVHDGWYTGIEIDGREFHNELRDEFRDACILGDKRLHEIIRFRGCDAHYHLEDCLFFLSVWHPELFPEARRRALAIEASEKARDWAAVEVPLDKCNVHFTYRLIPDGRNTEFIFIQRRNCEGVIDKPPACEFWGVFYRFVKSHGGGNLDQLISEYRHRQPARKVNC